MDRSGKVILTDLRGGEIAAGDLVLRMDIAQLLTTCGLRVGAERAVAAAVDVLGPDAVADSLPLLQPIALARATRATLRQLARERAQREREAVLEASRPPRRPGEATEAPGDTEARERNKPRRPKAVHAEKQAEKRAIDEALEEAREEDLLAQIRRQVLLIRPQAPVEPARLERVRPAHPDQLHRRRLRARTSCCPSSPTSSSAPWSATPSGAGSSRPCCSSRADATSPRR